MCIPLTERLAHVLPVWPFQDLEVKTQKLHEVDLDTVPMMAMPEEEVDSLAEYTFPKFAVTYFQKSASHTHIQKPLRYPLLYHENDTDHSVPAFPWFLCGPACTPPPAPDPLFRENKQRAQITMGPSARTNQPFCLSPQAALDVWIIILRFMGDLPEPVVYGRNSLTGSSVMRQIHDKLGKDSVTQHNRSSQVCGKGKRCPLEKDPGS